MPRIVKTVHEAVLLLDYVKSSKLTTWFGNEIAAQRKADLERLVMASARFFKYRRPPKDTGDGFFMTFAHESQAAECALAILQRLPLLNQNLPRPELTIHVRIGITVGELKVDGKGERKGEAANLAARFESMKAAELIPDELGMTREEFERLPHDRILLSGEAYEGIKQYDPVRFVGWLQPKDIRRRYQVYLLDHQCAQWRVLPGFMSEEVEPAVETEPSTTVPRELKPQNPTASRFELHGMDWYDEPDARYLPGREEDVRRLCRLLANNPVVLLRGLSGVGKSSLLRAGLLPALMSRGWRAAVVRPFGDPSRFLPSEMSRQLLTDKSPGLSAPLYFTRLRAELVPLLDGEECDCLVLLIDQIEDILSPYAAPGSQEVFRDFLMETHRTSHLKPMFKVVVAYRTEVDARIAPLWQEVSGEPQGLPYHSLMGISAKAAEMAIRDAAQQREWRLELTPGKLSSALLQESRNELLGGEVYPPYLQILLLEADSLPERLVNEQSLSSFGGMGGLVGRYLTDTLSAIEKQGGEWKYCRRILESLCTSSGEKTSRNEVELAECTKLAGESLHSLLSRLVNCRLVRPLGGGYYEIQHDRLAAAVISEMTNRDRESKQTMELVTLKLSTYPRSGDILTPKELKLIYMHRRHVEFPCDAIDFIRKSVAIQSCESEIPVPGMYWFSEAGTDETVRLMEELASHEDSRVRQFAVAAVGAIGRPQAFPLVTRLLKDHDLVVRQMAVSALAQLDEPEARSLLRQLARDEDSSVRQAVMAAIGRQCRTEDLPTIRECLRDDDIGVRKEAVKALACHKHPEDLPLLRELVWDEDSALRQAAVECVGEYGYPEDLPLMRELAGDEDNLVQWTAVVAIAKQGQHEDMPLLREFTRHSEGIVGEEAIKAMEQLHEEEDLTFLRQLVQSGRWPLSRTAVEVLASLHRPEDLPELRRLAKHEDAGVRWVAVRAIGEQRQPEDVRLLRELVRDPAPNVRHTAAYALYLVSPRDGLERWLNDECGVLPLDIVTALDDHIYCPQWLQRARKMLGCPANHDRMASMEALRVESESLRVQLGEVTTSYNALTTKLRTTLESKGLKVDKIEVDGKTGEFRWARRVLVVNRDLDFVVVNMGESEGLKVGDRLKVYKGKKFLGIVTVEKLYGNMSAAAIAPDAKKDEIEEGCVVKPEETAKRS